MANLNFAQRLMDVRNRTDYALRQFVRWRRPGLEFKNQPKDNLFRHLPDGLRQVTETRAAELEKTYHLSKLRDNSRADHYRESLYYLDLLEKALTTAGKKLPGEMRVADIGCSSWFYVQALAALLRRWERPEGRNVILDGFEADPYRVYADFHSRMDHAIAYLEGMEGAQYHPRPFTRSPAGYDLITMLFPFVFIDDALRWGLPAGLFQPQALLANAAASLKPGGLLIIVNQGSKEHERQKQMLEETRLAVTSAYQHEPLFFSYDIDRYVVVSTHEQHPS